MVEPDERCKILMTNISRRAIRRSEHDEMAAFVRWIGRAPYHYGNESKINALWALADGEDGEDDEEDEEENE